MRVSCRRPQSALAPWGDRLRLLLLQGPTRKIMPSSPPTNLISHPAPPLGRGCKSRKEATHAPTHTTHVCSKETCWRVRAKREAEFLFTGHVVSGTLVLFLLNGEICRNYKVNVRTSSTTFKSTSYNPRPVCLRFKGPIWNIPEYLVA